MQFLTSLFGGSENAIVNSIVALGIVLVLIVTAVWVLKAVSRASNTLVRGGRGRRLTVVDMVTLDQKRQLLLVRRDDVEHVILTGGPQDLVVESGIPAGTAALGRRHAAATGPLPTVHEDHGPHRPGSHAQPASASAAPSAQTQSPMERLRELARPVARASRSLRHTGLMRPISRMEPAAIIPMNPDNSDIRRIDSAKTGAANDSNGQARFGAGRSPGDGIKAEGN